MGAGDYPCWVYDPTGVNPPMLVTGDAGYVNMLNAPVPLTAVASIPPQTTAPPPVATVPVVAPPQTQVAGTTVVAAGARFTKTPSVGAPRVPESVNIRPNVRPKNG